MLERPPDSNLSRILLVPLGEAEEHGVVESALHERRVGLDNDTRRLAVPHDRTLLAERMQLHDGAMVSQFW